MFQRHEQTKSLSLWMEVALGLCDRRYADAEVGVVFADTATIDIRNKVSLKSTIIFNTHCRFFTQVLSPSIVLASDWFLTSSNIFSDLHQNFCHTDTVDIVTSTLSTPKCCQFFTRVLSSRVVLASDLSCLHIA